MHTIAIVGASVAGVRSAEALRHAGFDGRLVLVGDEPRRPYDRPPLSKAFLDGSLEEDALGLLDAADDAELALEMRLGVTATRLDPAGARLALSDGSDVVADGVVVATGGRARRLPGTEDVEGVHTLRTLDDALALRTALRGGPRVVVVGAGFIGAEVASTCRSMGLEVTVLDGLPLPLEPVLGARIARGCVDLHAAHGTDLRTATAVAGLVTAGSATGGRRVVGVALGDGSTVGADVVVVGIGIAPHTGWLEGSGLALGDGVRTDAGMVTDVPAVVAVGDAARPPGGRHEHWTSAGEQAAVAATNLLAGCTRATVDPSGYVWSEQYGRVLQLAGHPAAHHDVEIVDGDVAAARFTARFADAEGRTTGVFGMDDPRGFGRLRRRELRRPVAV
ncbi:FAD-dependent oxidoreductase [Actinomycetospora chlora]|uniref:FAD-dependent oxidoreductase n=1 Tax=Actinomycetospora chlora TaxID=663608 RepID=A0ABP9AUX8_9PSEU